ncbi:MAG: hypothetical protein NT145_05385 [Elusimicrobia bacterium]|nr:hypothetical protein [Elusimicrobiota bacterium]
MQNKNQNNEYEELDQYDYLTDEYFDKVQDRYSISIGKFLINFSLLEHELNLAIAEILHQGSHESGYVVIEKLSTYDKIDLFYKMYARLESVSDKKHKCLLNNITEGLKSINTFRNTIIHANWQSLSKEGYVRSKIVVDSQEGYVKFKKVIVTPKIIRQKINEIRKLINKIDEYNEKAFDF